VIRESRLFNPTPVFVKNTSIEEEKKLEDLLKKYEFKRPESGTKTITKKKLFTHNNDDDDEQENIETIQRPPKITPKPKKPEPQKDTPRIVPLTFLKSLDATANTAICDPEALAFRTNYRAKKQQLAERLFKLYNERVFANQLTTVPFKWNKKLLTTGGRCNNSRRGGVRNSAIELSDKVLTSADRLRCTLIHEMCHAAAWIVHGENGHGRTWKSYTARANLAFPELPKINVCHSYAIEYRYTYLCVSCKARSMMHTKSKKVEDVRCSICKGSIELFENKRDKSGEVQMVPVKRKEVTGFAKFVKLKFREVKRPYMSHQQVMQVLSQQFQAMSVEEKAML
jgi:predicted SprT family Zn-dependent metalloprotease